MLRSARKQPPDDLKGGVGLAGAGGHDQQNAILPTSDGLNSAIYGIGLEVTRHAAGTVVVIRRLDLLSGLAFQALPTAVALPKFGGAGKLAETQLCFDLITRAAAVVKKEAIAVAGKHKGHIQRFGVTQGLLHPRTQGMLVVLGLDNGNRQVWLVVKNVVSSA